MSGISKKIKLKNIKTGETVEIMATYGGWLKAARLVDSLRKSGQIGAVSEDIIFTGLWYFIAARAAGLADRLTNPAITVDAMEEFFEVWDLDMDDEEGEGAEDKRGPFAPAPTSAE